MHIIGLTGGIASGKSTVSKYLAALGANIIDADIIAREIVVPGLPAWQEILQHFGTGILERDKSLNRKELGKIIFSDPIKRRQLDAIMLPKIRERINQLLAEYLAAEAQVVVIDAPLLFETGMEKIVDETWVVYVPPQLQRTRLMTRDGITEEAARQRLASQMPIEEKRKLAHRVIDNSGDISHTYCQVKKIWDGIIGD
ncbi:MAG: dephospho-CoA kinase [Bacillota bacterium]|nr:dephospho-CoA kinase [Bacillota bacterium]